MSEACSTSDRSPEFVVFDGDPERLRHLGEALALAAASSGGAPLAVASCAEAERVVGQVLHGLCLADAGSCRDGLYRHVRRLVDRSLVEAGLRRARGCQTLAAEVLGISRNTLRSKMRELGIRSEDYADGA